MEANQESKPVRQKKGKLCREASALLSSKSVIGLVVFTIVGIVFTCLHLWDANTVDFFKWLGGFYFGSRAADNLTNINVVKGE